MIARHRERRTDIADHTLATATVAATAIACGDAGAVACRAQRRPRGRSTRTSVPADIDRGAAGGGQLWRGLRHGRTIASRRTVTLILPTTTTAAAAVCDQHTGDVVRA